MIDLQLVFIEFALLELFDLLLVSPFEHTELFLFNNPLAKYFVKLLQM